MQINNRQEDDFVKKERFRRLDSKHTTQTYIDKNKDSLEIKWHRERLMMITQALAILLFLFIQVSITYIYVVLVNVFLT